MIVWTGGHYNVMRGVTVKRLDNTILSGHMIGYIQVSGGGTSVHASLGEGRLCAAPKGMVFEPLCYNIRYCFRI